MILKVYEYDDRPEAPLDSPPVRHWAEDVSDATLCDAYIDTNWGDEPIEGQIENCDICLVLLPIRIREIARRQVAHELGVDESEVF